MQYINMQVQVNLRSCLTWYVLEVVSHTLERPFDSDRDCVSLLMKDQMIGSMSAIKWLMFSWSN